MQVVGLIAVTVPGMGRLETTRETKLNPGGIKRNPQKSATRIHFNEELMEAKISGEVMVGAGFDITKFNSISGVGITCETDTGDSYLVSNANFEESGELDSGKGTYPISFFGDPASKV